MSKEWRHKNEEHVQEIKNWPVQLDHRVNGKLAGRLARWVGAGKRRKQVIGLKKKKVDLARL